MPVVNQLERERYGSPVIPFPTYVPARPMSNSEKKVEVDPEKILLPSEKWWRSRYEFLHKHGYRLRSRYQPGWQPSWVTSGKPRFRCEDSYWNKVRMCAILIYGSQITVCRSYSTQRL